MSETSDIWCSIIMPVYQGESFLDQALGSLCAQDQELLRRVEVLAVDDGSIDRSREILDGWTDRLPLRTIEREGPSSWMSATNLGIRAAAGEWICFLHQDDRWRSNRLRVMRDSEKRFGNVDFFCHGVNFIDDSGRSLGAWRIPLKKNRRLNPSDVLRAYSIQNFFSVPGPFFKRRLVDDGILLRDNLWFLADWAFWIELVNAATAICCLNDRLAEFRLHRGSQTILRSHDPSDIRAQFEAVRELLLPLLSDSSDRNWAARAGSLNQEITIALATGLHGGKIDSAGLFRQALGLGPQNWPKFLRQTRLIERVCSRIKLLRTARAV